MFRDITPLLTAPEALDAAVGELAGLVAPLSVDLVVAPPAPGVIHRGAHAPPHGPRVVPAPHLVHDDLLATGGTAKALCDLVVRLGGTVVGCVFLIELKALGGRERLAPHPVHAVIGYDD